MLSVSDRHPQARLSVKRVVASVLLNAGELTRLSRLARGRPLGATLLALAERDIAKHGTEPMVLESAPADAVAKKLSVAIPRALSDAVDGRRGTASYGAYLRTLLGARTASGEGAEHPRGEIVVRAARSLPVGRLDELMSGTPPTDAMVLMVPDVVAFAEDWDQGIWTGISQGETGWLLVGLEVRGGPSTLVDRGEGERAFAVVRDLFRSDGSLSARVVLRPSFVFLRIIRGRSIGQARWVECAEAAADCVVLVVYVEAQATRAGGR